MLNSIKYNLSHLTDFNGRDARQTFWFYVLFLVVLQFAIGLISSIPLYVGMFNEIVSAIKSGANEAEMSAEMMSRMAESMAGYMRIQVWISAGMAIVTVGLLLASFVRRLHDGGFPGWIAAVPAATELFSAAYSIVIIDDVIAVMGQAMDPANAGETMTLQQEVAPYSAVAWIGYLVVIGFGVLKSQAGSNAYGAEPVRH